MTDTLLVTSKLCACGCGEPTPVGENSSPRRFVRGHTRKIDKDCTPVNDLDPKNWRDYPDLFTDTWWHIDSRDNSGQHDGSYWGNWVPQVPSQLMKRFSKRGDWVLDPFAGSGTTAIEARKLGRNCLSNELLAEVALQASARAEAEENPYRV